MAALSDYDRKVRFVTVSSDPNYKVVREFANSLMLADDNLTAEQIIRAMEIAAKDAARRVEAPAPAHSPSEYERGRQDGLAEAAAAGHFIPDTGGSLGVPQYAGFGGSMLFSNPAEQAAMAQGAADARRILDKVAMTK